MAHTQATPVPTKHNPINMGRQNPAQPSAAGSRAKNGAPASKFVPDLAQLVHRAVSALDGPELRVYLVALLERGEDGTWTGDVARLAAQLRNIRRGKGRGAASGLVGSEPIPSRTLIRALETLRRSGRIVEIERGGRGNRSRYYGAVYRVVDPDSPLSHAKNGTPILHNLSSRVPFLAGENVRVPKVAREPVTSNPPAQDSTRVRARAGAPPLSVSSPLSQKSPPPLSGGGAGGGSTDGGDVPNVLATLNDPATRRRVAAAWDRPTIDAAVRAAKARGAKHPEALAVRMLDGLGRVNSGAGDERDATYAREIAAWQAKARREAQRGAVIEADAAERREATRRADASAIAAEESNRRLVAQTPGAAVRAALWQVAPRIAPSALLRAIQPAIDAGQCGAAALEAAMRHRLILGAVADTLRGVEIVDMNTRRSMWESQVVQIVTAPIGVVRRAVDCVTLGLSDELRAGIRDDAARRAGDDVSDRYLLAVATHPKVREAVAAEVRAILENRRRVVPLNPDTGME